MFLKQSTAHTLKVGPFVSLTDAVTVITTLTGTMSVQLSKAGAAFGARNDATAITYDAFGYYAVSINATDTNTTGRLQLSVQAAATHLPVLQSYQVLPANVFDSFVSGSDLLQIDVQAVNDANTPADTLALGIPGIISGTVLAGSTAAAIVTNLTEATNTHYKGRALIFTSGALTGQALRVSDYNGATKTLSVINVTSDIPSNGDTFYIG